MNFIGTLIRPIYDCEKLLLLGFCIIIFGLMRELSHVLSTT